MGGEMTVGAMEQAVTGSGDRRSAVTGRFGLRRGLAMGIAALFLLSNSGVDAIAQGAAGAAPKLGPSGLPLPRFVSLKAGRVNVRVGPGQDYRVAWVFTRSGLPVEIVQEFDNWRRIRDSDGTEGWVFHSLLIGKRTAVVAPWQTGDPLPLRAEPTDTGEITAYLQPKVVGLVSKCEGGWCRLSDSRFRGWIQQDRLWGVYPDESVD
jgi:SH3-like domain-containing protein